MPAPEGPTSATRSPAATSRLNLSSAGVAGREGYANVTLSNAMPPAPPEGSFAGVAGARIVGSVRNSSTSRSVAPAARCKSDMTSEMAAMALAAIAL